MERVERLEYVVGVNSVQDESRADVSSSSLYDLVSVFKRLDAARADAVRDPECQRRQEVLTCIASSYLLHDRQMGSLAIDLRKGHAHCQSPRFYLNGSLDRWVEFGKTLTSRIDTLAPMLESTLGTVPFRFNGPSVIGQLLYVEEKQRVNQLAVEPPQ